MAMDSLGANPTDPTGPDSFGTILKALRTEGGAAQRELAGAAGIDVTYVSKMEHGAVLPPSRTTQETMAGVLDKRLGGDGSDPLILTAGKLPRDLENDADLDWRTASQFEQEGDNRS